MLISSIEFVGENIDFSNYNYQDDVTEMKNLELIKIKENLAQKSAKPKANKNASKKREQPKVEKIINIEKHIHEYTINHINQAPAPRPDIIMVSPDTSEAILEEESTPPQDISAAIQEQEANLQTSQSLSQNKESKTKPASQKSKKSAAAKNKKIKKNKNKSKKVGKKRKKDKEKEDDDSPESADSQATEFTPKQSKTLGYFYICSVIFVLLFSIFHEAIVKLFSHLSLQKLKFINFNKKR